MNVREAYLHLLLLCACGCFEAPASVPRAQSICAGVGARVRCFTCAACGAREGPCKAAASRPLTRLTCLLVRIMKRMKALQTKAIARAAVSTTPTMSTSMMTAPPGRPPVRPPRPPHARGHRRTLGGSQRRADDAHRSPLVARPLTPGRGWPSP